MILLKMVVMEHSVGSSIDFPSIERVRAPICEHFRARVSPSIRYSSIERASSINYLDKCAISMVLNILMLFDS